MKGHPFGMLAAAVLLLWPLPAVAAGFALSQQSARAVAMGDAFTAQASDPSAIFYNAAGIAFLEGRQLAIGGSLFTLSTDFTGADPYPGAGVEESLDIAVPVPVAYYTQPASGRVVIGIGLHAPFGLKTEWDDPDFSGRYISRLADLRNFSVNPTAAFKVSEKLALGGGLDLRLTSVSLERDVPLQNPFTGAVLDVASVRLESDTAFDVGFNIGVLAKPTPALSIGLSYRHGITAELEGEGRFTPRPTGDPGIDAVVASLLPAAPVPLQTGIAFPAMASLGVAYRFGRWTVEADVNWYGWSSFEEIELDFEGGDDLDQTIPEDYSDKLQYRFGAERGLGPSWSIRGGYYFDPSPAPAASVSPILPDPDRHGLSLGGSWGRGRFRVDGAALYVIGNHRSTEGRNRDGFDGTYRSTGYVFSAFVLYAF